MSEATPLAADTVCALDRDGVIYLRSLFDPGWLDFMREALDAAMASPGPLSDNFVKDPAKGKFYGEHFLWPRHAAFRRIALETPLPGLAAQLMRSRTAVLAWDQVFVKEPFTEAESHWHQDQPYAWVDGQQNVSFWIALDDATADSGALQFVKGSHRWGKWFEPKSFHPDRQYAAGEYEPMPDFGQLRSQYDIVCDEMKAGDVVAFHLSIVHYAPGNRTANRRRAISLRYAGDDATYAVRKRGPKLPRDPGLNPGDRLGGELFPMAWPRQGGEAGADARA
ncbi:MAG: phytanoyl-CoA dioxygenase family protein [Rhodospirillaceae bacterium]|nr:phytanoyl-CoA dioxygenase family protein [Rhodospirillaceae bacterium]